MNSEDEADEAEIHEMIMTDSPLNNGETGDATKLESPGFAAMKHNTPENLIDMLS